MKTWVQAGPKIFFWKLNSAVALFIFLKFLVWKFWKLFGSNASSFQFILGELGPTNPKRTREFFTTYSYELHSLLLVDQNIIRLAILFVKEKRFVKWPKPQICKLIETKKNWVPTCMKVILKGTLIFWKIFNHRVSETFSFLIFQHSGFWLWAGHKMFWELIGVTWDRFPREGLQNQACMCVYTFQLMLHKCWNKFVSQRMAKTFKFLLNIIVEVHYKKIVLEGIYSL